VPGPYLEKMHELRQGLDRHFSDPSDNGASSGSSLSCRLSLVGSKRHLIFSWQGLQLTDSLTVSSLAAESGCAAAAKISSATRGTMPADVPLLGK